MHWKRGLLALLLALNGTGGSSAAEVDDGIAEAVALVQAEAGDRRLLLLGEKHGTHEIPDFIEALVAVYASQGPVLLGLEIHRTEHASLRAYLHSNGGPDARAVLLDTPFWRKSDDQHDGRRSHDMVDLIEALRAMRERGADIAILPYDVPADHADGSDARDLAMAQHIRSALRALPDGRLLVLGGNVHAMLARPDFAPPEMQLPMGAHLGDLDPFAVDITAAGGQFWACRESCAPVDEYPRPGGSARLDGRIYHLRVVLPWLSVGRLIGAAPAP